MWPSATSSWPFTSTAVAFTSLRTSVPPASKPWYRYAGRRQRRTRWRTTSGAHAAS